MVKKYKDEIYIGIASFIDHKDEDFLIYDWRAPISSLYYDYALGKAGYETMNGKITGEVSLKRQFIIKNGHIEGMFDTGITIDRKSTRLNSSHVAISYAVFCLKKKKT